MAARRLSPHHRPPLAPCCPTPRPTGSLALPKHAGVEGTEAQRQAGTGTAPGGRGQGPAWAEQLGTC